MDGLSTQPKPAQGVAAGGCTRPHPDSEEARLQLEQIRARQAAGRAAMAAKKPLLSAGGAEGRFPAHWGEPPLQQTKDLRPLPGGYGQGSGTLATWIAEKMAADEQGVCSDPPPAEPESATKTSWPECVGWTGVDAVSHILADRPDLAGDSKVHTVVEGDMLTEDWREDRVRVTVDAASQVTCMPTVG